MEYNTTVMPPTAVGKNLISIRHGKLTSLLLLEKVNKSWLFRSVAE